MDSVPMPQPDPGQAPNPVLHIKPRELFVAVSVGMFVIAVGLGSLIWSGGDPPLTSEAVKARSEAFRRAGQLTLQSVKLLDRAEALASLQLAMQPADARHMTESDNPTLVWLDLYDDTYEDGDTVEVLSDGFARIVQLTNTPHRIAVPLPERGVIDVRGVYDGGGGITAAIVTPTGKVALPIMIVGQIVGIPVKIAP